LDTLIIVVLLSPKESFHNKEGTVGYKMERISFGCKNICENGYHYDIYDK
jgi:hypothetical protein